MTDTPTQRHQPISDALLIQKIALEISINTWSVMGARMMGLSGLTHQENTENALMVNEKVEALQESSLAVMTGMLAGAPLTQTMVNALRPYHTRTSENARRLSLKKQPLPRGSKM